MNQIKISDLFDIKYGNQFDLSKMESLPNSKINFISRSSRNMGIVEKVEPFKNIEPFPAGVITVTLGGTYLLSSFVQQKPFYTAQNIKVLFPKKEMSDLKKLFYCYCIEINRFKYTSHGREANKTLNNIVVPQEMPEEWQKININEFKPNTSSAEKKDLILDTKEWSNFNMHDLFMITGSKTTSLSTLEEFGKGKYPFVTTQATNNGVEKFYDYFTEKGNILTIDSAVVGYCSYQPLDFSASDHVEKLIPKFEMDTHIALFLTTIINKEQYRYNYGRKSSQSRLKQRTIKLPSKDSKPDWDFMRSYIKSLSYSANL